jgi:hypothetical protein
MQLGVDDLVALGGMERGWQEVAQYDINLEIGGTNVAQNDNYPHNCLGQNTHAYQWQEKERCKNYKKGLHPIT